MIFKTSTYASYIYIEDISSILLELQTKVRNSFQRKIYEGRSAPPGLNSVRVTLLNTMNSTQYTTHWVFDGSSSSVLFTFTCSDVVNHSPLSKAFNHSNIRGSFITHFTIHCPPGTTSTRKLSPSNPTRWHIWFNMLNHHYDAWPSPTWWPLPWCPPPWWPSPTTIIRWTCLTQWRRTSLVTTCDAGCKYRLELFHQISQIQSNTNTNLLRWMQNANTGHSQHKLIKQVILLHLTPGWEGAVRERGERDREDRANYDHGARGQGWREQVWHDGQCEPVSS